ncbi:hypothetical protein PVAP13_9KG182770 [Panicum virgatum]|uniref:Uncharacterized protein n=1 Tax=Panicum virgatum TaxID=38727 RepID=A0A8T0NGB1_PANVG|nr:hypothetical protein PVAP13_9KG182770 [Panicum virgatum]
MRSGGLDAVAGGVRSGAQICGAAAGNGDAVARSAVSASWFHCRASKEFTMVMLKNLQSSLCKLSWMNCSPKGQSSIY